MTDAGSAELLSDPCSACVDAMARTMDTEALYYLTLTSYETMHDGGEVIGIQRHGLSYLDRERSVYVGLGLMDKTAASGKGVFIRVVCEVHYSGSRVELSVDSRSGCASVVVFRANSANLSPPRLLNLNMIKHQPASSGFQLRYKL